MVIRGQLLGAVLVFHSFLIFIATFFHSDRSSGTPDLCYSIHLGGRSPFAAYTANYKKNTENTVPWYALYGLDIMITRDGRQEEASEAGSGRPYSPNPRKAGISSGCSVYRNRNGMVMKWAM